MFPIPEDSVGCSQVMWCPFPRTASSIRNGEVPPEYGCRVVMTDPFLPVNPARENSWVDNSNKYMGNERSEGQRQ